jgi:CheY-like chemotaxis protein
MAMDKRVLIADDDPGFVRMLARILEPSGVRVHETYDAISALTLIQRCPPDLVILDVNMPSGNGLSACEMMATDKFLSRIPVVIMSGDANDESVRRAQKMGAHFIQKGDEAPRRVRQLVCELLALNPEPNAIPPVFLG